jgi:outer membrane protein assembly factor BamE (lipoprotein component of BamABCDE complex)
MHGSYIDDDIIRQIKSEKMSKEQLVLTLGNPSIKPDYSPNIWYYVGRIVKHSSFSEPALRKQRIVKVTFNKKERVENIEVIDTKRQPKVITSTDHTVSKGTEENPVQSFIKNFGRFNNKARNKRR